MFEETHAQQDLILGLHSGIDNGLDVLLLDIGQADTSQSGRVAGQRAIGRLQSNGGPALQL